jgi:xanthine dehydrogenase iron-sulfur cluster and FAD-binding subunit A
MTSLVQNLDDRLTNNFSVAFSSNKGRMDSVGCFPQPKEAISPLLKFMMSSQKSQYGFCTRGWIMMLQAASDMVVKLDRTT